MVGGPTGRILGGLVTGTLLSLAGGRKSGLPVCWKPFAAVDVAEITTLVAPPGSASGARVGGMSTRHIEAFPEVVEIVVEIPRGSRNKYEYDEEAGVYRLDRVLSSAVFYNFDYGFIEGTRADDGDHTDALLIIDEPTFTGCHVWARPIGGLEMRDEKGFDFKTLCVALGGPHQQHIERLDQMRPHRLVEIEHFFTTYKLLEEKDVDVLGWRDRDRALEVLLADRDRHERLSGG